MKPRRGIQLGLGAVLLASAALGAFGLRALLSESERVRSRHLADALDAVTLGAALFDQRLDALARGALQGATALELGADGALAPLLGAAGERGSRGPADGDLFAFLEAEVDRLERDGRSEEARERLRAALEPGADPWLVGWARTALAAIAAAEGDEPARRAELEAVAALPPEVRDRRGLSRALAARHALAELDGAGFDERLALLDALLADRRALSETATAELAARVRAGLEPPDEAAALALDQVLAREARRAPLRGLAASDAAGFLFAARPGQRAWVRAPVDPLTTDAAPTDWVVARALDDPPAGSDPERGARGAAMELAAFARELLDDPELAAFARGGLALSIGARGAASLAGRDGEAPPLAARALPLAGAAGLELRAAAVDLAALRAGERRRLAITGGLFLLALLVAIGAAVATTRAVAREARAARERDAFVAAVSHELRTPLAATRLLSELLAEGGVEEGKVIEFATRIGVEAQRLSRLVSSILDLARLEAGAADGAPRERLDLRELARDAVGRFTPVARESGCTVELRAPEAPLWVEVARDAWIGALLNLLDNAAKHADQPQSIEVLLERDGRRARVSVLDRGRGVPPDERARVFEAFARVGDEDTRDRPGAGLGLALVRRVALAHGGGVACRARQGGGSAFVLELPLARGADGGAP